MQGPQLTGVHPSELRHLPGAIDDLSQESHRFYRQVGHVGDPTGCLHGAEVRGNVDRSGESLRSQTLPEPSSLLHPQIAQRWVARRVVGARPRVLCCRQNLSVARNVQVHHLTLSTASARQATSTRMSSRDSVKGTNGSPRPVK